MWRTIKYYPNYEVSTNGKIRNRTTLKILKSKRNKNGYAICLLYNRFMERQWVLICDIMYALFTMYEIANN